MCIRDRLKTQQGTGAHMKTDIFTGKMWYGFKRPGEPFTMAGFPIEVVRDILAQNKEGIEPEVDLNMVDEPKEAVVKGPDYENVVGQDDLTRFDGKAKSRSGGKRKSRNKRGGGNNGPRGGGQGQQAQGSPAPAKQQGARPEGERGQRNDRRRRGRGPRGGGQGRSDGGGAPKPPSV